MKTVVSILCKDPRDLASRVKRLCKKTSFVALLAAICLGAGNAQAEGGAQVTISWTFASNNVDGTPLTDLAGAKVYYGTASSNYTHIVNVPGGLPGQACSFAVTGLVEGTVYYLNGTAYNTYGLESDFCKEIAKTAVLPTGNQPPQVNAIGAITVVFPAAAQLQGTVTDDGLPAGSTVSIAWEKVTGPGTVTFANANAADTTASFSLAGSYTLRVTASDGEKTASSQVVVTVQHVPGPPEDLRLVAPPAN